MRNKQHLFNALPIVAAAYADKIGVTINIGGQVAYTDGQSINLPEIPNDAPQKDAIWGYLAHEGAHVRFTDFMVDRKPGIHAELVNIIEDCRIEQLMIKAYPGTATTLLDTAEYMLQAGHYDPVTASSHPASVLSGYMLYWLQAYGVGQPILEPLAQQAERVFQQVFPAGASIRMRMLLNKCVACKSTQEAADLANEILKMIEDEEEKEQQQQQQQQQDGDSGDGSDASQGGDSGASGDDDAGDASQQQNSQGGDTQGDDGQGSDSSDQGGSGDGDDQDSKNQGESTGGSSNDANEQDGMQSQQSSSGDQGGSNGGSQQQDDKNTPSLSEQIRQAGGDDLMGDVRDAFREELSEYGEPYGDTSHQAIQHATDVYARDNAAAQELSAVAKSVSTGIRQQMMGLVQASQRKASSNTRSGNRINTGRLARVRAGETKVFNKPADKVLPNTAVHILVDMSSSMRSKLTPEQKFDYEVAREAALAIAYALEGIPGVNPAVSFFGPHIVQAALRHGQRVNPAKFAVEPGAMTPMAEALWFAGYELSKCKEQRKLVICITDGAPDSGSAVKKVLSLYDKADVESIGVGIQTSLVAEYFKDCLVIQEANDLRATLFKLMQSSLVAA